MSYKFLNEISVKDLREICKSVGIENPENISKSDLISYLKNGFKKYNFPEPEIKESSFSSLVLKLLAFTSYKSI